MPGDFIDRAWTTWCTTMGILVFLCVVQVAIGIPQSVWVETLGVDAQGYQISPLEAPVAAVSVNIDQWSPKGTSASTVR
jgi:hypothetical protein